MHFTVTLMTRLQEVTTKEGTERKRKPSTAGGNSEKSRVGNAVSNTGPKARGDKNISKIRS
jgi:hypothetical protein